MEFVYPTGSGQEHERTLSGDHLNAVFATKSQGLFAHRARTARAIHPDPANAGRSAIGDYGVRNIRFGHEQRTVHWWLDLLHSGKTRPPHYFWDPRIYGHDVITAAFEFLK